MKRGKNFAKEETGKVESTRELKRVVKAIWNFRNDLINFIHVVGSGTSIYFLV